jgi:putative transposase
VKYQDQLYYHIYNRGVHKEQIFFEDENYRYFESLLLKYSRQSQVTIVAYCLMPNHYHIVARQNLSGSLPSFMKKTFSAYTQAINKRFGLSGSLFQGQAKIKEITTDQYCLQVIRYVHLNPVNAGLVQKPEDWLFSDYRAWLEDTNPVASRDLSTSPTADSDRRGLMRDAYFASGNKYRQFVEEYRIEQTNEKLDKFLFKE